MVFNHAADNMIRTLLASNLSGSEAMQRTRFFAALASLPTRTDFSCISIPSGENNKTQSLAVIALVIIRYYAAR